LGYVFDAVHGRLEMLQCRSSSRCLNGGLICGISDL
jgi:hypothetical protein